MAKNREQLNLEAEELGIDPAIYDTKAELIAAIEAVKPASDENSDGEKVEASNGCGNCSNTGLEPGVARDTAQVCPVCKGSPFEPREEVK